MKQAPRDGFVDRANLTVAEFIALAALLTSMGAMSIDIMLPLLPEIGKSFAIEDPNDRQFVVLAFSLAFAGGQLIFAPLSDRFGRKALLLTGLAFHIAGSAGSALAGSFEQLLLWRFIQGLGGAALRSVVSAMVRDCFAGDAMGRIMTFVMTLFMLVPMAAPFVGQTIGGLWGWHAIFWFLASIASLAALWTVFRLRETIDPDDRRTLALKDMAQSFRTVISTRLTIGYTVAATLSFSGLFAFILSVQQIFGELYALGELFPVAFAGTAMVSAIISLSSARFIRIFGARMVVHTSIAINAILGFVLLLASLQSAPSFSLLFPVLSLSLGSVSIMQGNAIAISLEPLGKMAGMGAAIVGASSTMLAALIGGFVGQSYNGTIQPLALSIFLGSTGALLVVAWAERGKVFPVRS
ncbi:multidrug effflux MFS transporter [Rhizobium sp. L1K21]|uniref:multidrug effflux MFS transporter n=1 Tax=Rhizobium sp. L1K21 TaxID=2954933 RepID=UPI002092A2B5|nr:multidrug effflux MFS transporter [Rhizobium sp. L1K21]MCO6185883.1 multidrug effflux MFS transporter [Rhizobium sp. L1K21]